QAARALGGGAAVEAKLGWQTPAEGLLARAAVDYANLPYSPAGVGGRRGGVWWARAPPPRPRHGGRYDWGQMSATTLPARPRGLGARARTFLEAIKFEHTIFALPFAYLGMLLAARGAPTLAQFVWITVAMGAARTLAMALNRLIDREIDARNPRTATRALPRRLLSAAEMSTFA